MGDEGKAAAKPFSPIGLAIVFLGSIMVTCQAAIVCDKKNTCDGYNGWAVAFGGLSFSVVVAIQIVMLCCGKDTADCVTPILAVLLWVTAVVGLFTLTQKKQPFRESGDNGWWGTWIVVLGSTYFLGQVAGTAEALKPVSGQGFTWFLVLLFFSVVGIVEGINSCDYYNDCKDERGWAIAAHSVSAVMAVTLLICAFMCQLEAWVWKWVSFGFLILWLGGWGVVTYSKAGPFGALGNGYLATTGSLFASALLVAQHGFQPAQEADRKEYVGVNKLLISLFIGSLMVFIQAIQSCRYKYSCRNYDGWAVSCASVSVLLVAIGFVLHASNCVGSDSILPFIFSLILVLFWMPGTYLMTIKGPFDYTNLITNFASGYVLPGNGYFGSVICLVLSWVLFLKTCPWLKDQIKQTPGSSWTWRLLALSSLLQGVQAAYDCDNTDCGNGNLGYAVSAGWVSFTLAIVYIFMGSFGFHAFYVALFFFLWWWPAAGVLTYDGPYTRNGNGYFGTWLSTVISTLLFFEQLGLLLNGSESESSSSGNAPTDAEDQ